MFFSVKYNWIIYFLISVVITLFVGIAVFYVGMVRGKLDYVSVNPEYYNSNGELSGLVLLCTQSNNLHLQLTNWTKSGR